MEWEPLVDEGILQSSEDGKAQSMPRLNDAWDCAIRARRHYDECRYDAADAAVREAMTAAGESLCFYHGYRFAEAPTFETSERVCSAYFKPGIADAVFERARILGGMMPLPQEELDPDVAKRVRHSIGASAELCAMVEAFVYFQ